MDNNELMIKAAEELDALEKTATELREENAELKKQIADNALDARCEKIAASMFDSGMISNDEMSGQVDSLKNMSGEELDVEERAIELSGTPKVASLSNDLPDTPGDPRESFYASWNS